MGRTTYKAPSLLLVEGTNDRHFFARLCDHLGLQDPRDVQITALRGKDNLEGRIAGAVRNPGFKSKVRHLGIARDADDDPAGAWRAVCSVLEAAGLAVPERPMEATRNRPRAGDPRVTVMILPRQDEEGMLEDVCLRAIAGDSVVPCVDEYFSCLQRTEGPRLPARLAKRRLQVFLASRREYVPDVGEAAKNTTGGNIWSWDHDAFDEVKRFLRQISDPSEHDASDQ